MTYKLLSTNNQKFGKSNGKHTYMIAGLSLSPASRSGYNLCKHSTGVCRLCCVADAGGGRWAAAQAARIRKTRMFFGDRDTFAQTLADDLRNFARLTAKKGHKPAVRLNTFSDIPWERVPLTIDGRRMTVIEAFTDTITFYDYTKYPCTARPSTDEYHLTYSASGENTDSCKAALAEGYNVAVVFDTKPSHALPSTYWDGVSVVDGDKDDLRFLDPHGVIIGLRAKHTLRSNMDTSFVFSANITQEV
jgi:hypothetical protein